MRERLNAEGHDESEYLPRGCPPVNAFRERHGGVVYEGSAIKALSWFPDILLARQILEHQHVDSCLRFYRCYVATNQALGVADALMRLASESMEGIAKEPKDIYFAIMRQLLPYQSNLLLWLICDDRNRGNVPLAYHLRGSLWGAIEIAQNCIDSLSKTDNIPLPVSPQPRPEIPRIARP